MKTHTVILEFEYDEETYLNVKDRESAINEAIEEINRSHIASLSFKYKQSSGAVSKRQQLRRLETIGFQGLAEDLQDNELNLDLGDAISHIDSNSFMIDSEIDAEAFDEAPEIVREIFK